MYQLLVDFFMGPGNCILAIPPLLIAALVGAGAGAIQNKEKQRQANIERQYQADTAKWSPWTGMASHSVQNPSMIGDVIGGAATGLSFGAGNPGLMGGATSTKGAVDATSAVPAASQASSYKSMLDQTQDVGAVPGYENGWMAEDQFVRAKDRRGNPGTFYSSR